MDVITSNKNQFVKEAKGLNDKKLRDKTGLFVVEGIHVFKDLPEKTSIEYVLATETRRAEVENLLDYSNIRVYYVSQAAMEYAADTVSPYGILAVCKRPVKKFVLPGSNALLLDGVSDPGNLGTILRTAAATGFSDVYLLDTADVYSPKVVRATLGAIFRVNVYEIELNEASDLVKNTVSVALDMNGESLTAEKLSPPVLLIAGNESHGIRKELLNEAKTVKCLPMKNGIESLNVAVAAAVAMYQTI